MPEAGSAGEKKKSRPLEGRYGPTLSAAVMSLVPFIVTSVSWEVFSRGVGKAIGESQVGLELTSSMSVAAYAFGALMGGDIVQRFPQRRLFLLLETAFVAAALVAATAGGEWQLGVGMVGQGLTTGLLLVAALPPVVQRFPAEKMPYTAAAINMGFFGAITAGPLLGGAVAFGHAWRWYFGGLAGIGLLVLLTAFLSLPDQKAMNPGQPFDWYAGFLGLGATFLPFYASGVLQTVGFASYQFTVPLAIGVTAFVALIVVQYHKDNALSPVKAMWHTYPIIGTLIAMFGGGIFVTLLELGLRYLTRVQSEPPLAAGLAFWPMLPVVVVGAVVLGLLVRTRWLPVFILVGMLSLTAAAAMLGIVGPGGAPEVIAGVAALLGLGAGATVSPGLWMAGFSLPSKMVGRIFALVELVRSVADFILAPVFLETAHVASQGARLRASGISESAWMMVGVAGGATLLCVLLFVLGGRALPRPDLERWLQESKPAFQSPKLFGMLRG